MKKKITVILLIFAVMFIFATAYYFIYQSRFINLTTETSEGNLRLGKIFSMYPDNKTFKGKHSSIDFITLSHLLKYSSYSLIKQDIFILINASNIKTLQKGVYIYKKTNHSLELLSRKILSPKNKILICINKNSPEHYLSAGVVFENIILGLIDNNISFYLKQIQNRIYTYTAIEEIIIGEKTK